MGRIPSGTATTYLELATAYSAKAPCTEQPLLRWDSQSVSRPSMQYRH